MIQEGLGEEDLGTGQVAHRMGQEILEGLRLREFWQQGGGSQHGPAGLDSLCLGQTGRGQTPNTTPGNTAA